jgi:hypothetical protein
LNENGLNQNSLFDKKIKYWKKNIFESVCAFPECNTVVAEVVSALKEEEEEEAPSLMFDVGIKKKVFCFGKIHSRLSKVVLTKKKMLIRQFFECLDTNVDFCP